MKRTVLLLMLTVFSYVAWSQENAFTISGGYAFAALDEAETDLSGYRINGLYEFYPNAGKLAHGVSIGYIGISGNNDSDIYSVEYDMHSLPIYYAPKYLLGNGKVKGMLKGALGMHFSGYKATGGTGGEVKTNDAGFYGGLGAGFVINMSEKMFLVAEYEWAWMSNSYYRDGFMNSASLGLGFKF